MKSFRFLQNYKAKPLLKFTSRGFTLVELLVAVVVLVVISAISITTFSSTLKNNRDKKRLLDLGSISKALELYRHDWRYYPTTAAFPTPGGSLCSPDGLVQPTPICKKVYMEKIPKDPGNGQAYKYIALPNSPAPCEAYGGCTSYALCAWKEGSSSYDTPPSACDSQICDSASGDCKLGISTP